MEIMPVDGGQHAYYMHANSLSQYELVIQLTPYSIIR